jgi:hypothetical protein
MPAPVADATKPAEGSTRSLSSERAANPSLGTPSSGTPISLDAAPPNTSKATAAAPAAGKPTRPSSTPLLDPRTSTPLPFGAW